jgi:hypothetical protein
MFEYTVSWKGKDRSLLLRSGCFVQYIPSKEKMSPKLSIVLSDKSARLFRFLFFKKSLVLLIALCTMFGQFLSDTVDCEHTHDLQERQVFLQL